MSEHLLRTFVSVTVPKEILSLQDMLKTTVDFKGNNLKWVKPGQIHLTLKFIGYAPPDAIDEMNIVLNEVVSRHVWMNLTIIGTGCFPVPTRPRILWLGLGGEIDSMKNFVSDINKSLEKLGFPVEEKEFIPHITIGRISYPPKSTPDVSTFLQTKFEPVSMSLTRIRFMSSELFPNGPIYSILGTHFLKSKGEKE